jgi:hypothetical protein
VIPEILVRPDRKAKLDHRVSKEKRETQEQLEPMASMVTMERPDCRESKVKLDHKVSKEKREIQEQRERMESMVPTERLGPKEK